MYSFGGRGKYYFDFEIARELVPDLTIGEERVKSTPHYDRKSKKKVKNSRNSEINSKSEDLKENIDSV